MYDRLFEDHWLGCTVFKFLCPHQNKTCQQEYSLHEYPVQINANIYYVKHLRMWPTSNTLRFWGEQFLRKCFFTLSRDHTSMATNTEFLIKLKPNFCIASSKTREIYVIYFCANESLTLCTDRILNVHQNVMNDNFRLHYILCHQLTLEIHL